MKIAYVAPKARVHYVQAGDVAKKERDREREKELCTKLAHCAHNNDNNDNNVDDDHDDHFVDIMKDEDQDQEQQQDQDQA